MEFNPKSLEGKGGLLKVFQILAQVVFHHGFSWYPWKLVSSLLSRFFGILFISATVLLGQGTAFFTPDATPSGFYGLSNFCRVSRPLPHWIIPNDPQSFFFKKRVFCGIPGFWKVQEHVVCVVDWTSWERVESIPWKSCPVGHQIPSLVGSWRIPDASHRSFL